MAPRVYLRDAAIALALSIATAAGLVTLTPWPWTINLPAAVFIGTVTLIADILLFDRPAPTGTRKGRATLAASCTIAGMAALILAFAIGRHTQPSPQTYPFIVTGNRVAVALKAAPIEGAVVNRYVGPGVTLWVDCYVSQPDGYWYRLADYQGWLRDDELVPAPHSGLDSPPQCPS